MNNMELGVQLYTLRKDLKQEAQFPAVLRRVKDMGAQTVQFSGTGPYDSRNIGALCRSLGLSVCGTHSKFERIQNALEQLVQEHKQLSCPQIGIGMMPGCYDKKSLESVREFIAFLNETGQKLQQHGMTIAYHNHWFEFKQLDGKPMLDWMIEETQPYVQFILDTYWVKVGGHDPCDYIKKLHGRMSILHLKDYKKTLGFVPAIKAIGAGTLDFPSILEHAQAAGVKAAVVELDIAKDPYASLEQSLRYLHGIEARGS